MISRRGGIIGSLFSFITFVFIFSVVIIFYHWITGGYTYEASDIPDPIPHKQQLWIPSGNYALERVNKGETAYLRDSLANLLKKEKLCFQGVVQDVDTKSNVSIKLLNSPQNLLFQDYVDSVNVTFNYTDVGEFFKPNTLVRFIGYPKEVVPHTSIFSRTTQIVDAVFADNKDYIFDYEKLKSVDNKFKLTAVEVLSQGYAAENNNNIKEALLIYNVGAEMMDPRSMYRIGSIYLDKKEYLTALQWIYKAYAIDRDQEFTSYTQTIAEINKELKKEGKSKSEIRAINDNARIIKWHEYKGPPAYYDNETQNSVDEQTSDTKPEKTSSTNVTEQGKTVESNNVELSNTSEPQMGSTNINGAPHEDNTMLNEQIGNAYVGYVHALVEAINGGDFGQVSSFLLEGSPLWDSQIALVNNLVQKEIKEKVVEAHVVNIDWLSDNDMELKTKETITILYPSGKSNTKVYYWKYKATYLNGNILFSSIAKWSM